MLSAEEPASNDQAPGPIIARVRSQQLGVQSRLRSRVADGWSWACMGPLRPDLAPTDSFVRNGSSISSRSRNYVCGSQEVRCS